MQGNWKCKWCAVCHLCGSNDPGVNASWTDNYSTCGPCASLRTCPSCMEAYAEGDLIVQCQLCVRWLHGTCDSIRTESEAERCAEDGYTCLLCRWSILAYKIKASRRKNPLLDLINLICWSIFMILLLFFKWSFEISEYWNKRRQKITNLLPLKAGWPTTSTPQSGFRSFGNHRQPSAAAHSHCCHATAASAAQSDTIKLASGLYASATSWKSVGENNAATSGAVPGRWRVSIRRWNESRPLAAAGPTAPEGTRKRQSSSNWCRSWNLGYHWVGSFRWNPICQFSQQ